MSDDYIICWDSKEISGIDREPYYFFVVKYDVKLRFLAGDCFEPLSFEDIEIRDNTVSIDDFYYSIISGLYYENEILKNKELLGDIQKEITKQIEALASGDGESHYENIFNCENITEGWSETSHVFCEEYCSIECFLAIKKKYLKN
jgi:hypothetical protein